MIMRKIIIILIVLMTVSCNKVDDTSLNGQLFTQYYPTKNCLDNMYFNKNTVTMTYVDCRYYKDNWVIRTSEYTYNYSYKNGILAIDGLEVLSSSIGYGDDKIIIRRDNEVGYVIFHRRIN